MLPNFSCSEYHDTGFEGIHLLVYKNNSHIISFPQFFFSCVIWLGTILFKDVVFSHNHQGCNIFKMKKQKWNLRGFWGGVLLQFPDSTPWIFKKYT